MRISEFHEVREFLQSEVKNILGKRKSRSMEKVVLMFIVYVLVYIRSTDIT